MLRNAAGVPIWNATGYGNTFLSAKGDMKSATKQILRAFGQLKYKFNESLSSEQAIQHPYAKWTEDSVKTYLKGKRISPIEPLTGLFAKLARKHKATASLYAFFIPEKLFIYSF